MDLQQLVGLVEQATLAPSVHNTQPWRFQVSRDRVEVRADRARAVPVIDPTGRQLHISCGAAIEYLHVGVVATGWACAVSLLPDPGDRDLLAVVEVGRERRPSEAERALAEAIPRRHTFRDPFEPRPVPDAVVESMRAEVTEVGGWLHVVRRVEDLVETAVLLSHAEEAEQANPDYLAELARWTGVELTSGEGVPLQALPHLAAGARAATLRLREFQPAGQGDPGPAPAAAERPLVVVLGTEGDDRASWLVAGRALARLLLRAAVDGVFASPLNQVLDQPSFRTRFARGLGLLGAPQMVLRMGFADARPTTTRRSVVEVVEVTAEGQGP